MSPKLHAGIVGDFDAEFPPHRATISALEYAGAWADLDVESLWQPTLTLAAGVAAAVGLASLEGIWLAPGSPYRSIDGALAAARFAREHGTPLLAT